MRSGTAPSCLDGGGVKSSSPLLKDHFIVGWNPSFIPLSLPILPACHCWGLFRIWFCRLIGLMHALRALFSFLTSPLTENMNVDFMPHVAFASILILSKS